MKIIDGLSKLLLFKAKIYAHLKHAPSDITDQITTQYLLFQWRKTKFQENVDALEYLLST